MKKLLILTAVILGAFISMTIGCGMGTPKEGSSCAGIDPMEGKVTCDGQKIIFCSSYSNYKYQVLQTCSQNKKCVVSQDGKTASCKKV